MAKIYTKKGDYGKTSLLSGTTCDKDDIHIELLGQFDTIQAMLGHCHSLCLNDNIKDQLFNMIEIIPILLMDSQIQSNFSLQENDLILLEKWIDEYSNKLPPLNSFILPIGNACVSYLHVTRTKVREVERRYVSYSKLYKNNEIVGKYLNRLSDYLFQIARYLNQ